MFDKQTHDFRVCAFFPFFFERLKFFKFSLCFFSVANGKYVSQLNIISDVMIAIDCKPSHDMQKRNRRFRKTTSIIASANVTNTAFSSTSRLARAFFQPNIRLFLFRWARSHTNRSCRLAVSHRDNRLPLSRDFQFRFITNDSVACIYPFSARKYR